MIQTADPFLIEISLGTIQTNLSSCFSSYDYYCTGYILLGISALIFSSFLFDADFKVTGNCKPQQSNHMSQAR